MNMRKVINPGDPFKDPDDLLNPGSPNSGRRVSFSIPEDEQVHYGQNDYPRSSTNQFTDSPTSHSPKSLINQIPPYPRAYDSSLSLKSQLKNAYRPSKYGTSDIKSFLPRSAVEELIQQQTIEEYWLGIKEPQYCEQLSDVLHYVFGKREARIIFAIVVLMGEPSLFGDLMRDGVYDNDLPLSHVEIRGEDSQFVRNLSPAGQIIPVRCFAKWSAAQVNYFGQLQRELMAEVLESWPIELQVNEVPNHSILPFTECESIHDGNSEVFRVKVHRAHHKFKDHAKPATDMEDAPFALKVLEAKDEVTFKLEVKALMKIKAHQHLVTAVTAFKYQEKYHLLFNWADGGTLADFWKTTTPSLAHESMCWLAQQCHGLAGGLGRIHNAKVTVQELTDIGPLHESPQPESSEEPDDRDKIHGRHGDIKPENILWFSDEKNEYERGVLKITDFGVTAFHNAKTTKVPAKFVPRTMTYAAPEIEVSDDPYVSRPFDIWSLGCVYLEFITWVLMGNEGLAEFEKRRMSEKVTRRRFHEDSFYSIRGRGRLIPWSREYGSVKKSVVSWIIALKQNEHCTPFLKDFLVYIQTKMLVDKRERETSDNVRAKLAGMMSDCQKERSYASSQVSAQTGLQHGDATQQPTRPTWKRVITLLCG